MASLIDNLIEALNQESEQYEALAELSVRKTPVIVKGDLQMLQKITDEEQIIVAKINRIDKQRHERMKEIAGVLNTDVETLKLTSLLQILERRPAERQKLAIVYDRLKAAVQLMKRMNERNKALIENALEINRFELNMMQAMKTAPETANYTRDAHNDGSLLVSSRGRFDAKQ